jgi:hypothetical protein
VSFCSNPPEFKIYCVCVYIELVKCISHRTTILMPLFYTIFTIKQTFSNHKYPPLIILHLTNLIEIEIAPIYIFHRYSALPFLCFDVCILLNDVVVVKQLGQFTILLGSHILRSCFKVYNGFYLFYNRL